MSTHNFTVHKNTLKKRKIKNLQNTLLSHAKTMSKEPDLAGYVIVTWDSEAGANTAWRTEKDNPIPGNLLPSFLENTMTRALVKKDVQQILDDE